MRQPEQSLPVFSYSVATAAVLVMLGTGPGEPARRPPRAFVRAWATATKAAGVPDLLFHDLRRTAVRNLVRSGVSQKVAQEVSGHKSATVFARYNITSADDRREAMKKVAAFQSAR